MAVGEAKTIGIYRPLCGITAFAGFATLFLGSRLFAMNFDLFIMSQKTAHTLGHLFVYGVLSVLAAKAMNNRYVTAWVICVLLASSEEVYQLYIPGRVSNIEDGLVNLVSITLALMLARMLDPVVSDWLGGAADGLVTADAGGME